MLKLVLGFFGFSNWLTPLLIAGSILGAGSYIYFKGYQTAAQKYELAQLRVDKAALEARLALWKKNSEADAKQAEDDAKALDDYEAQLKKLKDELKDPARPCLDADDVDGLRSLK